MTIARGFNMQTFAIRKQRNLQLLTYISFLFVVTLRPLFNNNHLTNSTFILMKRTFHALLLTLLALLTSLNVSADNGNFSQNRTDFRDESIYFVITTRFFDGDEGNNVLCWDNQAAQISTKDPCWRGDFRGLINKLDYIKALGFTAIWITPVVQNASGYDYHGYHASDFSKVDCRYQGVTGEDANKTGNQMFEELIKAAHAKGIKIILDIVLNHTGNFGEAKLMHEFTRDEDIRNQASINDCMIPDYNVLPSDYLGMAGGAQCQSRLALMKNTDGQNHDKNNYWHHVANSWNWDDPSRWWGQIAGDCVDLNTENPAVDEYLIECYEKFIEMGVDGFRIDTSGHIAPLTFNTAFIPRFKELGEKYASKRLLAGQTKPSPFYMYGEVCARYSGVTYRDQPILSPYYYTWKSSSTLEDEWKKYDASWWASQTVKEGAAPLGNMVTCTNDDASKGTSNNAWLVNGAYHTPDYSQSSGFNVIDFPVHYNFSNVGSVWGMTDEDNKYNDATWNVVYVDSHDYGPQPNDGIRFSGSTEQWAENLTWMFLFRGIPCLYYGSEVQFQAGKKIDNGPNGPLSDTGRAYFGQNIEGDVSASDFGQFTASGQVEKTLNHPLAKHLERLNRIRQAVPALRKGQYAKQSSTSGWAWSKAYNANGENSYVCVAQQAGTATFSNIPNGTYSDCVTGDTKTVTNGTLIVSCPTNQGNARVYVLNGPGKIGEDGPFLYTSTAGSADNSGLATDGGAEKWIGPEDAVGSAGLSFSPAGTSFTSESLTVNVSLVNCTSAWYSINGGEKVNVTGNTSFTIGKGDATGTTYTVTWGATPKDGSAEKTGSQTYKKVGVYTPSVTADEKSVFYETDASSVAIWVWNDKANFTGGAWDKKPNMEFMGVNASGKKIYKWTYDGSESSMPSKVIFIPAGGSQSADLEYKNHGYYVDGTWDHEVSANPDAISVALSEGSTSFKDNISVTATVKNATGVYTTDGTEPTANSNTFADTKTFTFTETTTLKVGALKDGKVSNVKTATYTKSDNQKIHAYFVNNCGWSDIHAWVWTDKNSYNTVAWPGDKATKLDVKSSDGYDIWEWIYTGTLTDMPANIIWNNNGNGNNQTSTFVFTNGGYYTKTGIATGLSNVTSSATGVLTVYDLNGRVAARVGSLEAASFILKSGVYIINGKKYIIR